MSFQDTDRDYNGYEQDDSNYNYDFPSDYDYAPRNHGDDADHFGEDDNYNDYIEDENKPAALSSLMEETTSMWSDVEHTGVTVAALTDDGIAACATSARNADAETLVKLAASLLNQAVQIDPHSVELIGATAASGNNE